ncbi:MAG TPA: hypothetical protein VHB73_02750, partial [Alphaproteobacteria bacterium]|nr:hypothetical protein [Alphaproteobacteria bacterium]
MNRYQSLFALIIRKAGTGRGSANPCAFCARRWHFFSRRLRSGPDPLQNAAHTLDHVVRLSAAF